MSWQKGQSGNPNGRRKSAALMQLVREQTDDGCELIEFAISVLRGKQIGPGGRQPTIKDRLEALYFLAERGWGLPKQEIDVTGPEGVSIQINRIILSEGALASVPTLPVAPTNALPEGVVQGEVLEVRHLEPSEKEE